MEEEKKISDGNGFSTGLLHEERLRNPSLPVNQIVDQLLPYLHVLINQFHPDQVILFGSYAYGHPNQHSDIDLLIIKPITQSPVRDATAIRSAWRYLRWTQGSFPFDLLVESPEHHQERLAHQKSFYAEIVQRGLSLL